MLFKKHLILSCCFLTLLWGLWLAFFAVTTAEDVEKLQALSKEASLIQRSGEAPIYQHRWGVTKDIYVSELGSSRLHHRIQSDSSILALKEKKGKLEVVEELKNMHCWIQEKFYQHKDTLLPMHSLRYFEATDGVYRHHRQELIAADIDLYLYQLPGQELLMNLKDYSPFLKGKASQIHFFVSENLTNFNADNFQAQFETPRTKSP